VVQAVQENSIRIDVPRAETRSRAARRKKSSTRKAKNMTPQRLTINKIAREIFK
jgi:hypothetical protein